MRDFNRFKVSYSPYQRMLAGLSPRWATKMCVKIQQEKIDQIVSKVDTKGVAYGKYIKRHEDNIEFLCSLINQQILEDTIEERKTDKEKFMDKYENYMA